MTDIWCLSGEMTREQAEVLDTLLIEMVYEDDQYPPTLSYFEQPDSEEWKVDLFFTGKPDEQFVSTLLSSAGLSDWSYTSSKVEDRDWVSESQKLLQPVHEGNFYIYGSHDADTVPTGVIALQIDAGQAFGTGQHETTAGCLRLIHDLKDTTAPKRILDLGTGTGVLALAAQNQWQAAQTLATDIDPIAIDVTRENLTVNHQPERKAGETGTGIALAVAEGLDDPVFTSEGPFDLIIANILAAPLIDLSADITASLSKGAHLILSGLLITQKKEVLDAYTARGLETLGRVEKGEWAALLLRKP
ncbi:ribosomal protein L11 methyltransferase [Kordiimonas sediminis]|uniref:Ribosomal protein L11 methyltransferase n=1 Tax=Kordiimonas sediminis TaxID=1735581 RepID=A0A919ARV3_9PROT|nr:50S ribosomal protein L11 methyltransferase [Kordiimonas sediminis]GHF21174.1 ribosomal protein L11 methyltransferase [Kordiimonas sediminis]